MSRIVLVTGGTKGIGLCIAQAFFAAGDTVVAASRRPAKVPFDTLPLDVSNDQSIVDCVRAVREKYGRLDILVGCAGLGVGGPMEGYSFSQMEQECRLNLVGAAKVIKAALPLLRESRGRVISISSVAARIPLPYQCLYSASKAALSAMSDALRLELWQSGVQFCALEPGDTKTGFTAARTYAAQMRGLPCYRSTCESALNAMISDEIHGKNPDTVARTALKVAKKRKMPARRVVCADYKLLCLAARFLPHALVEIILRRLYFHTKKDAGFRYPS